MNRLASLVGVAGVAAGMACEALVFPARALAGDETKPEAATPLDAALRLYEEGKFDEAAAEAEKIGADDPLRAKALYVLGEIHLAVGDAAKAETEFREALGKKAGNAAILSGIGRALLAQDKAADAVDPFKKAVAADSKTARYRAWHGLALTKAGKGDEGKKEIAAAVKADPADPEVARAAVEERLLAKDVDGAGKAAAAFSKAKKESPLGPFLQGLVLDRATKVDEAIASYEKALALDAGFLDAHKNIAILCIAQNPMYTNPKRTRLAMEHFEKYQSLGGKDPEVIRVFEQLRAFIASQGGGK